MKRYISVLATLLTLGISLLATPVYSQTPDEETPAEEVVCDALLEYDSTPGLYGLCVAFCEAHDAQGVETDDVEALINATPNRKILDTYRKRMDVGYDIDMPCVHTDLDCPAWTNAELDTIFSSGLLSKECYIDTNNVHGITTVAREFTGRDDQVYAVTSVDNSGENFFGRYSNSTNIPLTEYEYQICTQQIIDHCEESGVEVNETDSSL